MHGLAPVLVLADEPAQWGASTSEASLAALRTGARQDSRLETYRARDPASRSWPLVRRENAGRWIRAGLTFAASEARRSAVSAAHLEAGEPVA